MGEHTKKLIVKSIIIVMSLLLFLSAGPFFIVSAGYRGVILRFGAVNRIVDEGLGLKIPFIESIKKLSIKTQKEEATAKSASRDLQSVTTVIALNYNLVPDKVGLLWQEIGRNYKSKIIIPAIQEAVKAATAQYNAEELITKRENVREDIKSALKERLARSYINVTELSIVDFDFSTSFNAAIEAKVTAEQRALEAENKLEQVKFEAQQKIEKAKAEAEAIRIQAQAITQQGGKDYVQLKAIEKWDGKLPQQFVPNSAIPFINLKNK